MSNVDQSVTALEKLVGFRPTAITPMLPGLPVLARWQFEPLHIAQANARGHLLEMALCDFRMVVSAPGAARRQATVRRGTIILTAAGDRHRYEFLDRVDALHLYMPVEWFSRTAEAHRLDESRVTLRTGLLVEDPFLSEGMTLLQGNLEDPERPHSLIPTIAAALAVRLIIAHSEINESPAASRGGLPPHQLTKAKAFFEERLGEDVTLDDVARHIGVSPRHFARAFRQSVGLPPHQWLLRRRIERARELLKSSDSPIAQVAVICGFADQSHFTSTFRRSTGVTPARYRGGAKR